MQKAKEKKTPRRANGEGSITYKEDKKLFYARITVGVNDNGAPKRKSKYFKKITDAKNWLTEQRSLQLRGYDLCAGDCTFGALGAEWLETNRVTVSGNTHEKNKYFYEHLKELKNEKIKDAPALIQALLNRKAEKLAPGSLRSIWFIARQIFEIAFERDMIRKIPKVKLPEMVERIPKPLSEGDMIKLLNAAEKNGSKYSFGVWLELGTGLRRSEMLALEWEDIDLEKCTIRVHQSLVRIESKCELKDHTKTKAGNRIIPVPAIIIEKLKKLPHQTGHLFKTESGNYLTPWNWSRLFRSWRKIAGLDEVRFHDLRHQFATLLMEIGTHARVAQSMTGHKDMPTLLERYTHVQPGLMRDAANKLNDTLKLLQ